MKKTVLFSLVVLLYGVTTTSCKGEKNSCVEEYMEEGLSQSTSEEKCDTELVETVIILDELK